MRGNDGDVGNNGQLTWQDEVEISAIVNGLDEESSGLTLKLDTISGSWDAANPVDHSVILSTATSVPVVGNLVEERVLISHSNKHLWSDFMYDPMHHGVDLLSLCWSAGRGGWRLVVGMGWQL